MPLFLQLQNRQINILILHDMCSLPVLPIADHFVPLFKRNYCKTILLHERKGPRGTVPLFNIYITAPHYNLKL